MATDHTPHPNAEAPEDDRLLDIWLFTLFALGVFIFILFVAPRGCGEALREKPSALTKVALPDGATLPVRTDSFNHRLLKFLASKDDAVVPKTFVFDHLNFKYGTAQLTPTSVATVNTLATILKTYPSVDARLEGHTEGVGDAERNKLLSFSRAESVKELLVKNGVAAKRITTEGYGQEKPVAPNDTQQGRAKNRRIELVVLRK